MIIYLLLEASCFTSVHLLYTHDNGLLLLQKRTKSDVESVFGGDAIPFRGNTETGNIPLARNTNLDYLSDLLFRLSYLTIKHARWSEQ